MPPVLPCQHDAVDDDGDGDYGDQQGGGGKDGGVDASAGIRKNDLREGGDAGA